MNYHKLSCTWEPVQKSILSYYSILSQSTQGRTATWRWTPIHKDGSWWNMTEIGFQAVYMSPQRGLKPQKASCKECCYCWPFNQGIDSGLWKSNSTELFSALYCKQYRSHPGSGSPRIWSHVTSQGRCSNSTIDHSHLFETAATKLFEKHRISPEDRLSSLEESIKQGVYSEEGPSDISCVQW